MAIRGLRGSECGTVFKRDEFFWPPRKDIPNAAVMVGVGGHPAHVSPPTRCAGGRASSQG